jgi:tetratricopeptide (TPR) repeat protein
MTKKKIRLALNSFILFFILGVFGNMYVYSLDHSIRFVVAIWVISLSASIIGYLNGLIPSYSKIRLVKFFFGLYFLTFSIASLKVLISSSIVSIYFWITPLLLGFIFIWTLPLMNLKFAITLSNLFYKKIWQILIAIFIFEIALCFSFRIFFELNGKNNSKLLVAYLAMGTLSYFGSLIFSQEQNPNQKQKMSKGPKMIYIKKEPAIRNYLNGEKYALRGEFEKAIQYLNKAIELKPDYLDAYFLRGNAYSDSGQPELAVKDFNYVIQQKPEQPVTYYNRSLAYLDLKQFDQAIADLGKVIQLSPDDPAGYNLRSVIYSLKEKYGLAIKDATKVIELGEKIQGLTNRSMAYESKDENQLALADLNELLKISPKNSKGLCRRGLLLKEIGENDQALRDLKAALKDKKSLSENLYEKAEKAMKILIATQKKSGK